MAEFDKHALSGIISPLGETIFDQRYDARRAANEWYYDSDEIETLTDAWLETIRTNVTAAALKLCGQEGSFTAWAKAGFRKYKFEAAVDAGKVNYIAVGMGSSIAPGEVWPIVSIQPVVDEQERPTGKMLAQLLGNQQMTLSFGADMISLAGGLGLEIEKAVKKLQPIRNRESVVG